MATATPTGRSSGAFERWLERGWALGAYLGAMLLLVFLAAILPGDSGSVPVLMITVLGVAGFAVGVAWQRPDLPVGWWLVAGGAAVGALAAVATTEGAAITGALRTQDWVTAVFATVAFALMIAGLAVLGRLGGRTQAADTLDAAMIALATFLLLFALAIHPVTATGSFQIVIAVIFPTGSLLVFAMACRILLAARVPTVAVGLLLIAMAAVSMVTAATMASALTDGAFNSDPVTAPLWVLYSAALGAAGLHPSLRRTRRQDVRPRDPLSPTRLLLFGAMALVAPLSWGIQRRYGAPAEPLDWLVPLVTSGIILLLPLIRLALLAQVAQRRADALARRSEDLAEAVQEQQDLQRQLHYQAMHDPLTGLVNRVVISERIEWALTRPAGMRRHTLAIINLDHFKDVNDALGHAVGDELLVAVSHRIMEQMPTSGMVARLGSDEFAALLEDFSPQEAVDWGERVRQRLRQPFQIAGHDLIISASIGVLTTDPGGPAVPPSDVLRDADVACQAAKAAGGNRVTVFRPELRSERLDFSRISTQLRQALVSEELRLHYQPVVDLTSDRIVAVEALLRWRPSGGAPVPPSTFVPIAEEANLIGQLGAWVIRQACREARPWHDRHGVNVGVNVSARQLEDPNFADMVLAALRDAGMPGDGLIIEITESSLVATSATSAAMDQLRRLRSHRIRVAIDDFGTGYSSLAYVGRLPVDMVKIDSSFVRSPPRPDGESRDWAFTRAVLHLVEAMNLPAVAEGVEHPDQAAALRALRCPYAQGYFFGRPMPPADLERALWRSLTRA